MRGPHSYFLTSLVVGSSLPASASSSTCPAKASVLMSYDVPAAIAACVLLKASSGGTVSITTLMPVAFSYSAAATRSTRTDSRPGSAFRKRSVFCWACTAGMPTAASAAPANAVFNTSRRLKPARVRVSSDTIVVSVVTAGLSWVLSNCFILVSWCSRCDRVVWCSFSSGCFFATRAFSYFLLLPMSSYDLLWLPWCGLNA